MTVCSQSGADSRCPAVDKADDQRLVVAPSSTGYAPIRPEYQVSRDSCSRSLHDSVGDVKREKRKGQNKKRSASQFHTREEVLLCSTVAIGSECKNDNCKWSHSVEEYLEHKPSDISDYCVLYATFGKCPQGFRCRYGREHSCLRDGKLAQKVEDEWSTPPRINSWSPALAKELRAIDNWPKTASYMERNPEPLNQEDVSTGDLPLTKADTSWLFHSNGTPKLFLAPLTTVGNLPFRRLCVGYGAEITCSEMAYASHLVSGKQREWALVRRHPSEKTFGVQICGNKARELAECAELLSAKCSLDFIDLNMGCPLDDICRKGSGQGLMARKGKLRHVLRGMTEVSTVPVTVKIRTGKKRTEPVAERFIPLFEECRAALTTLHGRSREQRYTKQADWSYIAHCSTLAKHMKFYGNGDIFSFEEYYGMINRTNVDGIMIGRGALIKPWIFTEIQERRDWDISSSERLDMMQKFVNYGLEYWGSDSMGVSVTRRALLEAQSFWHRYIPIGLLERLPQAMNDRPPPFVGRNDLESLMASSDSRDWVKLSELLLGKAPENFHFIPKHKANSFADRERP